MPFSSPRIDYIKTVNSAQNPEVVLAWKFRLYNEVSQILTKFPQPGKSTPYKFSTYYNTGSRIHVNAFECWGETADHMFDRLSKDDLQYCRRLDWRYEIDGDARSPMQVHERASSIPRHNKRTVGFISSPVRAKTEKRDAGGSSTFIGTHGSDCRSVYYRRGKEKPAAECQFGSDELSRIINDGFLRWNRTPQKVIDGGYTFYDAIRHELNDHWHNRMSEFIGADPSWLYFGSESDTEQADMFYDPCEQLIMDFDAIWAKADDTVKATIKEVVNEGIQPTQRVL